MKTRGGKRMVKHDFLFFSKIAILGRIFKNKKSTHPFFGARSFLVVHIGFTPSEGPKGFVKCFF